MDNKELEASFRKAKALGDDIREMESIDALAAYRQSQMKIRSLKRTRLHNQLIRCAAFLAIPLLLASLTLGYLYFAEPEEIRYASYFYYGNGGALRTSGPFCCLAQFR